jgi:ketosteroid isomerase-like protein
MSEENVEIVRRMWDAFLAGDVPAALWFYAPDVEWDGTNLPDGRIGHGHQAILDHVARWAGVWDDWTVEVERVHEVGSDQVVLFMREKGRSDNGLTMDERHAELYTLTDGMIVRRQGFSDPNQALEAARLSEEATSEENVESVLRGVDAFNRRDVEAFAALGTPDVEVVPMRAAVEAISYRGPEGVAQFFAE